MSEMLKKWGGHRLRFGENLPGRAPYILKNWASLVNRASVCKPNNITILLHIMCGYQWDKAVTKNDTREVM